jgi:hypothetical protein
MVKRITLPSKPSELLKLALADVEAAAKTPGYKIDMGTWHSGTAANSGYRGSGDGLCTVCMAGSVLAMSLKLQPTTYVAGIKEPFESGRGGVRAINECGEQADIINRKTANALLALNEFRAGYLDAAYRYLGRKRPASVPDFFEMQEDGDYETDANGKVVNGENFMSDMRKMISMLEAAGE